MKHLDRAHLTVFAVFLGLLISGLMVISAREAMHVEDCRPYLPTEKCALARYEIRLHDLTDKGQIIGVAEGSCVTRIGSGKHMRYAMPDATFTAMNRTDVFDNGVEIPVTQSQVCKVE